MFNILISTVLLSISVIGLTYFITSTGAISIMENNTVASNNISLSINSSVTAGSFIQIIILLFVGNAVGDLLGTKMPKLLSKIKS